MVRKLMIVLTLALPALLFQPATAAEKLPPAAQWIPQNAVFAVELWKPKVILDLVLNPKVTEAVSAMPVYKQASAQPGFQQFLQVVSYLEMRLGTDWKTGLHKLLDGGITWAVTSNGASLLIVDAEDGKLLSQLHEIIAEIAKAEAAKAGQPNRVTSADYRGVTGWAFAPDEAHMILGNRLLLTNKPDALKAVIDLRAEAKGASLATLPEYLAARKAAGNTSAATAFVNLAMIKKNPAIQKGLTEDINPMGSLLFAGLVDAVRASNWLAMKLSVEGQTLSLQASVDGKPAGATGQAAFAWPSLPDEGALPNLSVPRQIAGMSFYRNLHTFYADKDKLFPERTSGLIFFENMMGIFFSGRELTEDIMAQPKPEIRFVVAEQKYDPEIGTPKTQFPAFAAIFRLRKPKEYGDVVEAAWQKAVGLVNVTRGQKAEAGLVIDKFTHNDTRYTVAYFASDDKGEKKEAGTHLNFRPSLVKLGDNLVFSSTEGLAKDLIDALKKEAAGSVKPVAGAHSLLQINAVQLASVLDANRQNLIHQNMLEKGAKQEEAETQIGLLVTVVKHLGEAKLTFGSNSSGQQANLEWKLNLP